MHHRYERTDRGAALPLALILLGVFTVVAVAAVSLATQERRRAADDGRVQFMNECANLAQAKLWADLTAQGVTFLGSDSPPAQVTLLDGTRIMAPAHYDSRREDGTYPSVKSLVLRVEQSTPELTENDCTNGACGLLPPGTTNIASAICTDADGRELELELAVKLAF